MSDNDAAHTRAGLLSAHSPWNGVARARTNADDARSLSLSLELADGASTPQCAHDVQWQETVDETTGDATAAAIWQPTSDGFQVRSRDNVALEDRLPEQEE